MNTKDMDADMPWRVEDAQTPIPVLWIIKDADQWLAEVDEMKYVVLYDVSDGGETHGPRVRKFLPPAGGQVYFRVEAYTYDPAGPPPPPGDVSNFSYDATVMDYNFRCFTNPIWVTSAASKIVKRKYVPKLNTSQVMTQAPEESGAC